MDALILFNEMYLKYNNCLTRYIHNKIRISENGIDADDLICEIWMKVYKHLDCESGQFNPDIAQFSTWLYNIANNHIIDFYRKTQIQRRKYNSITIDNELNVANKILSESDIQKDIENKELRVMINKSIENLKPNYRQIAELYLIQEKSYDEIAEILNLPLGTIKVTLFRAKELLQKVLSKKNMQLA